MDPQESSSYQQAEKDIQGLFAKCEVPSKGSSGRIADIIVRGLHELSLRDLIQFTSKIVAAMLDVLLHLGAPQQKKFNTEHNGERK